MEKQMQDNESPEAYISRRIDEIFQDLADEISKQDIDEEAAAAIPFELMTKSEMLKRTWAKIVNDA